jgi:predicted RecB family nuclease
MPAPHLSKSRYLSGLRCDRRLWLDTHSPSDATPPSEAQRHIFSMGSEVGRAAHSLFPDGVLVEASAANHAAAVRRTQSLMANEAVAAIFEAAFEYEGVRIRVDVLERRAGGRWGLREVKSSSRVKREQHLPDLAIQKWVLAGCGVEVDSAELVHVNGNFILGPGEIDWSAYFRRVELIEELDGTVMDGVAARVTEMHETLAAGAAPTREPGSFCKKPHLCNYWDKCTAGKSATWFVQQTGASAKRKARMIEITESRQPWFSEELAEALAVAAPPVWALDFEAIGPGIPFFEGTKPYQALAFQWSLHRLAADGEVEHFEYLASGREDPRSGVARALVEVLGQDDAPVLAYSGYEKRCLKDMAAHLPELAGELEAIVDRLVDLLEIVRAHVYHPDLLGSFSIKKVGPAFAPDVGYADLSGVADGMAALGAFAEIVKGEISSVDEDRIREELLQYCARDTLALLEVYRALRSS